MKTKKNNFVARIAALGLALIAFCTALFLCQPFFREMDDKANESFNLKAKRLALEGKSKAFVRKQFGVPVRTYEIDEGDRVWVYIPGPFLSIWNSECKVRFNSENIVQSWGVRSD